MSLAVVAAIVVAASCGNNAKKAEKAAEDVAVCNDAAKCCDGDTKSCNDTTKCCNDSTKCSKDSTGACTGGCEKAE